MSVLSSLAIDTSSTVKIPIDHPVTGHTMADVDGNPAYVEVVGPGSKEFKDVQRRQFNRRIKAKNMAQALNYDLNQQDRVELLVAITKGWYLVDFEGMPLDVDCSEANRREVYSSDAFKWLSDQVDQGVADPARFFTKSSKD